MWKRTGDKIGNRWTSREENITRWMRSHCRKRIAEENRGNIYGMNTYLYFARIDTTVNSTSSTDWAKVCFQTILRSSEGGKQSRFEQQWTHTPHQDYYHGVRISVCHHISCHHISLSRVPRIGAIYRCCWGQEQAWNPRLDYDKITIEQDVRLGIIINFRAE